MRKLTGNRQQATGNGVQTLATNRHTQTRTDTNTFKRLRGISNSLSCLFFLLPLLILLLPATSYAAGTAANTSITNGTFSTGDTVPQSASKVAIGYRIAGNHAPQDTRYAGFNSSGVSVTVDTGYDLKRLNAPSDSTGYAGDTLTFPYLIQNLSNGSIRIDLDTFRQGIGLSDTDWGSGAYHVFYDNNSDSKYTAGETEVTSIILPAGSSQIILVTVAIPTTAVDGDSSHFTMVVTDNAPKNWNSTTGDGWEDSLPISGNDSRDTQYDTVVTRVSAANVIVTKTVSEVTAGNSRPGDTLEFVIAFDNDGTDSARGVTIYDAVPGNARYVWNSADTNQGGSDTTALSFSVSYDSDPISTNSFGDTNIPASSGSFVNTIRWTLTSPLGEDNGDANNAVNYDGVYDNGRVRFRVWIQ